MSIQYQGAGYSSFEEFMNDTGVDKDNFADAKKSANEFGSKFQQSLQASLLSANMWLQLLQLPL